MVRVLWSGPHTPTPIFWEYSPGEEHCFNISRDIPSIPSPLPFSPFLTTVPFFKRAKHRKPPSSVFLCTSAQRQPEPRALLPETFPEYPCRAKAPLISYPQFHAHHYSTKQKLNKLESISRRKTRVLSCLSLLHGRKTYTNGMPYPSKRLAAWNCDEKVWVVSW